MIEIMQSIKPKWCELIFSGRKTIEVRKTRPKIEPPFKVYIYCTKFIDNGCDITTVDLTQKVIGEFVCDKIEEFGFTPYNHGDYEGIENITDKTCLYFEDLYRYIGEGYGYGWHISDLKIYDTPKDIREFGLKRPPQSWCYVRKEIW